MKYQLKIFILLIVSVFLPFLAQARDNAQITDWYIKDFQSTITVNKDSSLLVEEKIIADCGNLPDKHGIFRIIPTQAKTEKGTIKTPVELAGITDFDGNKIPYSAIADNFNHTVTWKIGDADKTVAGVNQYKIIYLVKNAIRNGNADFDELYWNILGNFWDIDIEKFSVDIVFPDGINQTNSETYVYSGNPNFKETPLENHDWTKNNTLRIESKQMIYPHIGITASMTFPKGNTTPYQPGFIELYGDYFWFLIPLMAFILSFCVWNKYGKDPVINKTIIPEFEIPENMTPMEMGLLYRNGSFGDSLISATIVDLAVKKYITIEEIPKSGIFGKQDFRLNITGGNSTLLGKPEAVLIDKIFGTEQSVLLSKLKNNFYKDLPEIKKTALESLKAKNLIYQSGLTLKIVFLVFAIILFSGAITTAGLANVMVLAALALSAAILLTFGLLMPKRTASGAELNWRIKGFKLYMETAEKYRAQFNEKENIFEKFLPYAIMFGMAKLWIAKMEQIYGKDYFAAYHPAWYAGAFSGNFDADSFTSHMNGLSAGIAANIGTDSGAHGAGAAGGGGGGGGGGGW